MARVSIACRLSRIGLFRHCNRSVPLPWNDPGQDPRRVDEDHRREKRRRQYENRRQKSKKASAHSSAMPPQEVVDNDESLVFQEAIPATSRLGRPLNQNVELTNSGQWNYREVDEEILSTRPENMTRLPPLDQLVENGAGVGLPFESTPHLSQLDHFGLDFAFPFEIPLPNSDPISANGAMPSACY